MKRFIAIFQLVSPVILLLAAVAPAQGHDFEVGGIYYNINDDGTTVSVTCKDNTHSWMTYTNEVIIPETVDHDGVGYTVTAVEDSAFYGCSRLSDVTIPATIISIGNRAFTFCNSLVCIALPASLVSIGTDAFAGCWSVTDIVVDDDNPVYDSRDGCNAIIETATGTLLKGCVNTVIPDGITVIGQNAFSWSKVSEVIIPEGVTAIEDYAFDHCYDITNLSLPNTLRTIGCNAFDAAFRMTSLTIPGSVTAIGDYAFHCCSGLPGVDFQEGAPLVFGDCAFYQCGGLKSLTLPNTLQSIGDYCFFECDSLASVHIPTSVAHVGQAAFGGCPELTTMTVDAANPTLDSRAGCNAIIETVTGTLLAGCPATVIPDGVTALGDGAFAECIGLNTIHIPEGVTAIGARTFDTCYDLDTIVLPQSLVTIGDYAFASCETLVYMTIPDAVESIGKSAFYDCPWMTYLTLGKGLSFIGDGAFNGCNLVKVNCRATTPPAMATTSSFWQYGSFSGATLCVPVASVGLYQSDEYWSLFPVIVGQGDLDGDGRITIGDVTILIDMLLGRDVGLYGEAADVNADHDVNIADVTSLIDLLLRGS